MKITVFGGLLAVWILIAAAPAWAQLSISADVPIVYQFSDDQLEEESISGFKVALSLPFLIGFGFESYEVTGKAGTASPVDYEYQVSMLDVFVDIPFPALNLVLGVGVGKGEFDIVPASGTFDDATLTQFFLSVGIPFAVLFDAHVGYHIINGESEVQGGTPLDVSAQMATIGIKIGF